MAMSRKHYRDVAEMFRFARESINRDTADSLGAGCEDFMLGVHYALGWLSGDLEEFFAKDNPNFNRQQFKEACIFVESK